MDLKIFIKTMKKRVDIELEMENIKKDFKNWERKKNSKKLNYRRYIWYKLKNILFILINFYKWFEN